MVWKGKARPVARVGRRRMRMNRTGGLLVSSMPNTSTTSSNLRKRSKFATVVQQTRATVEIAIFWPAFSCH